MTINKKMENWNFAEDRVIFRNYLFNLTKKDFERKTYQNRHFIKIFGVGNVLKQCYLEIKNKIPNGEIVKFLVPKLKCPKATLDCWITGRNPVPIFKAYELLKIWEKVCNRSTADVDKRWNKIFLNGKYYTSCGVGKAKLPKELTLDLAYIMGFILADGYVKNDDKLLHRKKDLEYSISMYSESKQFLKKMRQIFCDLFDVNCNLHYIEDKKGSWYALRCTSKPVHRFFCDILEFKRGVKTGNIDVPNIIANSPQRFQHVFIAGFFDGDGSVGISSKNPWLELCQTSINENPIPIIIWIKDKLKNFGINLALSKATYQNIWRLRTGSKIEILKFYDVISSRHPLKIQKYNLVRSSSYAK